MEAICEVAVTGPETWLGAFTRRLVEERLAACGQRVTEVRSVYRWEGRVLEEPEARVVLHTRESLVPELIRFVRAEHPYEVPCVLATVVALADPDYHAWVLAETREPHV